jgi:hypothetical protein
MERKIALMNAKTLRPYSILYKSTLQKRELIPIFFQKNQQKTKDAIENSVRRFEVEE